MPVYVRKAGLWLPASPSDSPPSTRQLLVPGTYKPDDTNTGVLPGITRASYNSSMTVTAPGAVVENLDIYGILTIAAANVTVRNVWPHGVTNPSGSDSATGLIKCTNAAVSSLVIEDCTLKPDVPHLSVNGILGHDFTARRLWIENCSDGMGTFNTNSGFQSAPANVTVEGCWVFDLVYWPAGTPGATQSDGTHNDCIQISGGSNYRIIGNRFDCYYDPTEGNPQANPFYPKMTGTAALIITPNVGAVADVTVEKNWMGGGAPPLNVTQKSRGVIQNFRFADNKFDHGSRLTQQGFISTDTFFAASTVITGNKFEDGVGTVAIVNGGNY